MMKHKIQTFFSSLSLPGMDGFFSGLCGCAVVVLAALTLGGCAAPSASIPPVVGPGAADPPLEGTVFLRNDLFRVAINTNDLRMTAMFLNSGRSWVAPAPVEAEMPDWTPGNIQEVRRPDPRTLEFDVEWAVPLTLRYALAEKTASIDITILPSPPDEGGAAVDRLLFPMVPVELGAVSPLLQEAVLPFGSGLLLPLSAVEMEAFFQAGLPRANRITEHGWNLPFYGICSNPLGSGCMIRFLTPTDAGISWISRTVQLSGEAETAQVLIPTPVHTASKGRFDQPIVVRMNFFETGGFLAMAKKYRRDIVAGGSWKDWTAKAADAVGIQRFDPLVVVWDEEMDAASTWDPEKLALLSADFAWIRNLPWDPGAAQVPSMLSWPRWNGNFSTDTGCRVSQLSYQPVEPLRELRVGEDGVPLENPLVFSPSAMRAPLLQLVSQATRNPQVRGLAIPSITRDVQEDWNPLHPATRAEDLEARLALLEMVSSEAGFPIAADGGPWWAEPYQDLAMGALSVRPLWKQFCEQNGLSEPALGRDLDFATANAYWDLAWNPATRIPLWQSVFHDATMATAEPYQDPARFPSRWARYDLFMLLYSAPACWWAPDPENPEDPIGPSPRHWEAMIETAGEWVPGLEAVTYGERKQRELQILAPWLARSLHLELTGLEFLSSDRLVQKASYGDRFAVVVNFSDDRAYPIGSLGQIPPRGYYLLENAIPFAKGQVDPLSE